MNTRAPSAARAADLAAARFHDADTFERLIEPYHAELLAHCYRMLGSATDAEDALQETLLGAWRALARFDGRFPRAWLYRIATNACLRMIERRPKRVLPIDYGAASDPHDAPGGALVEPVWLEPYPDETLGIEDASAAPDARYELRESVELAFIAALQHLPSRQRAVLLLRDVLGFPPAEIAAVLETTPAGIYSILQRARQSAEERLPAHSQQASLRTIGDGRLRELVERYVQAWEDGDVAAITEMLAEDATFSMPPRPSWYRGRAAVGTFLASVPLSGRWRWRRVPVSANGQPSFGVYLLDAAGRGHARSIEVLAVDTDARVSAITSFHTTEAFAHFGLPDQVPPRRSKTRLATTPAERCGRLVRRASQRAPGLARPETKGAGQDERDDERDRRQSRVV
jgi:RNA polymerase sigma-70 factor, ECF subfamily